ncbi:MAG: siroheme synthase CysG [Pseudomonadota bacterium]|nr:siroheme synthase CysG [Pseudomonadota bacterium]
MDYLPLSFNVVNKPCLIVGGGTIALRKAILLNKAQAKIDVISPDVNLELQDIASASGGEVFMRVFAESDVDRYCFVIAATDDATVNLQVANAANAANVLVNVVDTPSLCDVIFPAIIDRSPLLMSVSSSGKAPVLARSIRSQIESTVPASIGLLADFIADRRQQTRLALKNDESRVRLFWETVLETEITESVLAGKIPEAASQFVDFLNAYQSERVIGEVYLVGAGPGDPDLLTFKALRLMQRADVVLYDRLVAPEIVEMTRRDAERIYVGKVRCKHSIPQHEINQLLIDLALAGKKVVRLKGGDPFIFGRGGEEIEGLAERHIPFQVVPGISAANGCACYSGIPLTHRDHAQSVRFVTGHLKDDSMELPWSELVADSQTVVIYMGLTGLDFICQKLIAHGKPANTAIALIERGTTADHKAHIGTLSTITGIIEGQTVKAPTLIIIGSVVNLHSSLSGLH